MRALIIFIIVGIFLRSYKLDRALGGGDENELLLSWVYTPIDSIITTWSLGTMGGHHVFHTIVLRMMVLLFGEENELAIRLPAFLAGIAGLWFIYKVSREIFSSHSVAQYALLAAAISPIHIYYSQTARGYSFIMLFSTLIIYATLKILRSSKSFVWCLVLFLSGLLSIYTHPLSILFVFGTILWVIFIFIYPASKIEFGFDQNSKSKKTYQLFFIFLLVGIGSAFLYWPLIDSMLLQTTNYYNSAKIYSSLANLMVEFIPNFFIKIFPGPLIYFTPFIIVGIFFDNKCSLIYRSLPLIILLLTYLVTVITGLAWYPRAYLFNLPLILIFLGSGFLLVEESFRDLIKSKTFFSWSSGIIMTIYTVLCIAELLLKHYPSINTYDAKSYSKKILGQTQKNDLLLVADPRNYLYARSIYKKNLINIVADNHLSGIKILVNKSLNVEDYKVKVLKKELPVFFNWQSDVDFENVSPDRKLIHLNKIQSIPLLPGEFEATTNWVVNSGVGSYSLNNDHKFDGNYSLLTRASKKNKMVLQSLIGQMELDEPSLIILIWSTKKFSAGDMFFMPALEISSIINGKKSYGQITLGKVNEGMSLFVKEKVPGKKPYYWQIHSAVGWLPVGKFSLNLYLKSEAGKAILYDGLRLFRVNQTTQLN